MAFSSAASEAMPVEMPEPRLQMAPENSSRLARRATTLRTENGSAAMLPSGTFISPA